MKRHDFDWSKLKDLYDDLFGKDSFIISEDNVQAYVTSRGAVMAIYQRPSEKAQLTLHIRANLTPNAAAYIAMHGYFQEDFKIGENFAINPNSGDWLYGIEAMEYAMKTPELTWGVTIELAKLQKELKKNEEYSEEENKEVPAKEDTGGRLLN